MLLNVTENGRLIGTLELTDDSYKADPAQLADLVEARLEKGRTLVQAFDDLSGWSNGYVTVTAVEK